MTILAKRLAQLPGVHLDWGTHASWVDGHSAPEVGAWLCGEPHTPYPASWAWDLIDLYQRLSDELADGPRQDLTLLIPLACNTADDGRTWDRWHRILDWVDKDHVPACVDVLGGPEFASKLRDLTGVYDSDVISLNPVATQVHIHSGTRAMIQWLGNVAHHMPNRTPQLLLGLTREIASCEAIEAITADIIISRHPDQDPYAVVASVGQTLRTTALNAIREMLT